jgi:hypothetical protein
VTKVAGALAASPKFMLRSLSDALTRAIGGGSVFLDDADVEARKSYEDRAGHS